MSVMYCRKCSAPLLDSDHFCSVCGNSLAPQNEHPTLLTILPVPGASSPYEHMKVVDDDVENYKTSALPGEAAKIEKEVLDGRKSDVVAKKDVARNGVESYKTSDILSEAVEAEKEAADWEKSDVVEKNTEIISNGLGYQKRNVVGENAAAVSEITEYKTKNVVDENATIVEAAHVNRTISASLLEQEEESSSLKKNSYEGFAEAGGDASQAVVLSERNNDYDTYDAYGTYSPVQREQAERSVLADVPTALLKEDEADSALTAPGLLAQRNPATNPPRAEHKQAELSRVEHRQPGALRVEHRQPIEPQQAFSAHIQPPRPAAIVSRGGERQNFLFTRRYFFIGTSVILLISFITLITSYSYILNARSAQPPALTANANSAFPGGSLVISGTNFVPGGIVTIKADGVVLVQNAVQPTSYIVANLALSLYNASQDAGQRLIVQGDGTFETTLTVPSNWPTGDHRLEADEQLNGKTVSAKIVVAIYAHAATPTPIMPIPTSQPNPIPTIVPTPNPTPNPTPTILPTPTPTYIAQLPCLSVSANALNFNVTAGSSPIAQTIMLANKCGAGTWSARSDAAWLTANASGNIAAHGTINISVTASTTNLAANLYTGHIVFSAGSSQATIAVTLTVTQPITACIKVNPTSLSFSSISRQNAATQTLLVTNCGSAGMVTAIVSPSYTIRALPTSNGAQATPLQAPHNGTSWLTTSPGGVLAQGGTLSITVDVNSTTSNLAPGIYTSSIAITVKTKDGKTDTYMVNVTFTVHRVAIVPSH